jgi:hypothetical protein
MHREYKELFEVVEKKMSQSGNDEVKLKNLKALLLTFVDSVTDKIKDRDQPPAPVQKANSGRKASSHAKE